MLTVVDIGAGSGEFIEHILDRSARSRCVAVEPLAFRLSHLVNRPQLSIVPRAVLDVSGLQVTQMHVPENPDLASVLPWASPESLNAHWASRPDIGSEVVPVDVVSCSLETLLVELDIEQVDFIKIDAQGKDMEVLLSAGGRLAGIKSGVLELSLDPKASIYATGPLGSMYQSWTMLDRLGFQVYRIVPNDPFFNEFNVFFCRAGVPIQEIERELDMQANPVMYMKYYASLYERQATSGQDGVD